MSQHVKVVAMYHIKLTFMGPLYIDDHRIGKYVNFPDRKSDDMRMIVVDDIRTIVVNDVIDNFSEYVIDAWGYLDYGTIKIILRSDDVVHNTVVDMFNDYIEVIYSTNIVQVKYDDYSVDSFLGLLRGFLGL